MRRTVFHLLLVAVALTWMPFGSRDPFGVDSVLPALHPVPPPSVTHQATAATDLRPALDHVVPGPSWTLGRKARRPLVVTLAAFALAAAAGVATARGRARSRPLPRLLLVGGTGCRAPPLLP